jgi:hypothetical protein
MDPQTGTFLSVDPIVTDSADPQSYNAYTYARNNPIAYVDPGGQTPIYPQLLVEWEADLQEGRAIMIDGRIPYFPGLDMTRRLERRVEEIAQQVEQLKKDLFYLKALAVISDVVGMASPQVAGRAKDLIFELAKSLLVDSAEKSLLDHIREKELALRARGETPDNAWFDANGERLIPSQEKKEQRKELEITIAPPDSPSPSGISGASQPTGGGMTPVTAPATYDYYVPWTDPFSSVDGWPAIWDYF